MIFNKFQQDVSNSLDETTTSNLKCTNKAIKNGSFNNIFTSPECSEVLFDDKCELLKFLFNVYLNFFI